MRKIIIADLLALRQRQVIRKYIKIGLLAEKR